MGRRLVTSLTWPVLCVLWVCMVSSIALAGVEYSGALTSFSSPAGLKTSGQWRTQGFDVIGWDVSQNENGTWHYVYGRNTSVLDTVHFIIELPTSFTAADVLNPVGSFSSFSVGTFVTSPTMPFLPGPIHGVDFLILPGVDSRVSFDANIEPDFGNFYAQGGDAETSFNDGYLIPNTHHDPACGSIDHKILVPDTTAAPVPDASTLALSLAGIVPALAMMLRRRAT